MPSNFSRKLFSTASSPLNKKELQRNPSMPIKAATLPNPRTNRTSKVPSGKLCTRPFTDVFMTPQLPPPKVSNEFDRQTKRDLVRLVRYAKQELRLMVQDGVLCIFEGPCWKRLTENQGKSKILEVLSINGLDDCLVDSDCRAIYRRLLIDPRLQKGGIPIPSFWKLNLRDGTLDLRTKTFGAHAPEDYFFRYLDISMADIEHCRQGPTFEMFVDNLSAGDKEVRRQLLELTALAILHYPIKNFFVLLEPSNTGKTQFGRFLEELVGRNNVASLQGMDDFKNRFTTSTFVNKLLVTCLDLPDNVLPRQAVGLIKQLVGDDSMKSEPKGIDGFSFYDKPLLLCAGNHPIRISHMTEEQALLNRMVVIPFLNPVPEEAAQQQLYQALLSEAPYIVREALIAFQDLADRNFQVTRVEIFEEYQPHEGRSDYQAITAFVQECCIFDSDSTVSTQCLHQQFTSWSGLRLPLITFSRNLSEVFAQDDNVTPVKRTADGQRGYKGIRLCHPDEKILSL